MRLLLKTCLLTLLPTAAAMAGDGGRWMPRAPMIDVRQEPVGEQLDGKIYIFGGLIAPNRSTDKGEVYDIATDQWSPTAPMPKPRDHSASGVLNGKIYVIGGYNATFAARDTVYVYDPATDTWDDGPALPERIGAARAVTYNNRIYVFGGSDPDHEPVDSLLILDESGNWSYGAPLPTAREHVAVALVDDAVYAIGGRIEFHGAGIGCNERYDIATDTWTIVAPMMSPRSATAIATWGNRIMVAGGEIAGSLEINEIYNTETDIWTRHENMALPRHSIPAITLEDGIFCAGGGLKPGVGATNYVDVFVPGPSFEGTGSCPGLMSFESHGGTPGGYLVAFFGADRGTQSLFNGSVELGLDASAQIGAISRSDAQGRWGFSGDVPPALCGQLSFQVLDFATRSVSNVLDLE